MDNIGVNLITMEKLPTIMLGASYDWLGDDEENWERDWYVTLNINLPLFEGGALFSRLKQKKNRLWSKRIKSCVYVGLT